MFAADPRQNAVIVRDYAANMAGYRKLITELNQRQQMIEISVKIIDVNAGDINQLGIDWERQCRWVARKLRSIQV